MNKKIKKTRGGVAQLGEHLPCKQGVKSSNLSISIRRKQLDEPVRANLVRGGSRALTNVSEFSRVNKQSCTLKTAYR